MRYRVYLWRDGRRQAADIVHEVVSSSVDAAIQAVLLAFTLARVYYVWVVCLDDEAIDVHRYHVRCTHFQMKRGGCHGR